MAGGAGNVGGSGGMGQQPMGNASAQPGMSGGMGGGMGNASAQPGGGMGDFNAAVVNRFMPSIAGQNQGGGMGNVSAQPYNPTGGAPTQASNPTNMGSAMGTMFGTLGQPAGNASAQPQPFGMQPMQSPFQAPQQPSPMGGMNAQPAVLNPSEFTRYLGGQQTDSQMGMQNQMPPGMQNQTQSQMQMRLDEMAQRAMPGMQPGMQPVIPHATMVELARGLSSQDYPPMQLGFPPPSQTAQPMPPGFPTSGMPPGFGRQLGADEQAPNPYMQERMRSLGISGQQPQMPPGYDGFGLPPMQTPFQMPDGVGQLGPSPYPNPSSGLGQVSRPDLLKPMSQPLSGGIGSLASAMSQPQSKQQMKEQMRQQQRMGPLPRTRPGGQPQQMFNEPQQYM